MKTLCKLLLTAICALPSLIAFSQCVPNAPTGNPGVFPPPDSVPCIERNVPYDFTMHMENFDTIANTPAGSVLMDTLVIDSITNLPCGITWQASKLVYAPGETGCIRIFGTTQDPVGQYRLRIYASIKIEITGGGGSQWYSGELNDLLAQLDWVLGIVGFPPLNIDCKYVSRVIDAGNACPPRDTTLSSLPVCNITGRDTICSSGDTTSFTASGGASYAWSGPNGFTATGANTGAISDTGTYWVTVWNASACMSPSTCSKRLVFADINFSANISGDNEICQGQSTSFSADFSGSSYEWSGPNGFTANSFTTGSVSTAGTYSLTVTGYGGCTLTNSVALTVNPLPVISISGDNTICPSEATEFFASGGLSYQWSGPNGFSSSSSTTGTIHEAGIYSVTGTDGNGCNGTSSYELYVATVSPPEICIVGVDSATGKNLIVWEKPVTTVIDKYSIYRESFGNEVYVVIGFQDFSAFSTFIDTQSVPEQQSYKYKLGMIDTCGGVATTASEYHKTIHLSINQGVGSTWNLSWSHYEGFSFSTYNIYRGTSAGNLSLLNSVPGNVDSYTDLNPPGGGVIYYQIEVINPNSCNPSAKQGNYSSSRSNIVSTPLVGIDNPENALLKMYPNPFNSVLTIQIPESVKNSPFEFILFDVTGNELLRETGITGDNYLLKRTTLPPGAFYIEIRGKSIYRGKVIAY